MVEVFKKYILTSLILKGKFNGIPKNASPIVHRHLKLYCPQYIEIATTFDQHDQENLNLKITEYKEIFQKDKNYGLVKQCLSAFSRNTIQRLTETYLTLSFADIAKTAKLESPEIAEKILLNMVNIFYSI